MRTIYRTLFHSLLISGLFLLSYAVDATASTNQTAPLDDFRTILTKTAIYEQPDETSKILSTLHVTNGVLVIEQIDSLWTSVRYGNQIGYVYTAALLKAKTYTGTSYAKNIYHHYRYATPLVKEKYVEAYYDQNWQFNAEPIALGSLEFETEKGLYIGDARTTKLYKVLPYPIRKGTTFKSMYDRTAKIIQTDATVRTKTKTLKRVFVV
ncbi:hypothetical protein [Kurthia senegalensis]|uniref:hypothetical protein n=1 Tax=Kurthia senegalensis TaxID=1033740 RepID=UPI000287D318|nr:hypothetical protein [Kurthia senegalensis]